jgi:hypothetical protein
MSSSSRAGKIAVAIATAVSSSGRAGVMAVLAKQQQ